MASKKKQHFIPQFYMRYFGNTNNKFINLFHIESEEFYNSKISDECYENYLYGTDGKRESDYQSFEDHFKGLFDTFIIDNIFPELFSPLHLLTLDYIFLQHHRLPLSMKIDKKLDEILEGKIM